MSISLVTHYIHQLTASIRLGRYLRLEGEAIQQSTAQLFNDASLWLNELPADLQTSNFDSSSKTFRGAVHLHMTYNQIFILLGRSSLLQRVQQKLRQLQSREQSSQSDSPAISSQLSLDCVAAAYRTADLVQTLRDTGKLAKFSFTDFYYCSSAAVIIIINQILRKHPLYSSKVSIVLHSMELLSSGSRRAKYGLALVKNLSVAIDSLSNGATSLTMSNADVQGRNSWEQGSGNRERGPSGLPLDSTIDPSSITHRFEQHVDGRMAGEVSYYPRSERSDPDTDVELMSEDLDMDCNPFQEHDLQLFGLEGFQNLEFSQPWMLPPRP